MYKEGRLVLLPDGFIGGFPSTEKIAACPWFWSKKRKAWQFRPQFLGVSHDELHEMLKSDPAYG